ncbi:MAG: AAA family ATPase [Rhizobiaceae bacterium]
MSTHKPAYRNKNASKKPATTISSKRKRIAKHSSRSSKTKLRRTNTKPTNHSGSGMGIKTFTANELQHMDFPPVQYAVDGYIAEGLTLLAGKPKIGKSWMALDFAMAIATGDVALGSIQCKQGTVLYCALEDNQRRLQRRIRQRYGDESNWPKALHMTTQLPRLNEGGLEWVEEWVLDNNPALVIIDTFVCVRPSSKGKGGYDTDYAALSPLQKLAGELGVCIVVIHHLRKMVGDDPLDMISGTTGLTGAVDTALVLHRGGNGVTLYGRGREIEEVEMAVKLDQGGWKILGEPSEVQRSQERKDILEVLSKSTEPMGPKEIADVLDIEVNNIKQLLFKMASADEVQKQERGKYTLSEN